MSIVGLRYELVKIDIQKIDIQLNIWISIILLEVKTAWLCQQH